MNDLKSPKSKHGQTLGDFLVQGHHGKVYTDKILTALYA
jgi:hypothetical protein